jgi:hypothetical protein
MESDEPLDETLPPLPAGSMIGIYPTEANQLALRIPPGNPSASLGYTTIAWNGFMATFTIVMGLSFQNDLAKDYGMLIGLFWLVGAGLVFAWIKLRFERCLIYVNRERAVLRKMLFGRQQQLEAELDESSRAELTVSYRNGDDDRPVYRVSIVGADGGRMHFGASLDERDKAWCVDAINTVLRPQVSPVD